MKDDSPSSRWEKGLGDEGPSSKGDKQIQCALIERFFNLEVVDLCMKVGCFCLLFFALESLTPTPLPAGRGT